ncbi:hypothetical protein Hamer_G025369 [Homarus americanus]|uniref:Uncharacterized protein n=1 Tax=Homarus americanus TaxID=6706 RepID=A0A8J5MNI4_HOMAM|nr:hypothetical protein Hamer_G025369 [Homarus americanus]
MIVDLRLLENSTDWSRDVSTTYCKTYIARCNLRDYKENIKLIPDFALKIRMLPTLAVIPQGELVDAFETLRETMPPEADPVIEYFEDTYIGRQRRHNRRAPRFPVSMWNIYDRVAEDLPPPTTPWKDDNHMPANITTLPSKYLEIS